MESVPRTPTPEQAQWQEVVAHCRHWERLAFENARTAVSGVTAILGAAGYVWFVHTGELLARRSFVVALLVFAGSVAALGGWQVYSARRYLRRLYERRRGLERDGGFLLVPPAKPSLRSRISSDLVSLAALFSAAFACYGIGAWLLIGSEAVPPRASETTSLTSELARLSAAVERLSASVPLRADPPPAPTDRPASTPIGTQERPIKYEATAEPSYSGASVALLAVAAIGVVGLVVGGLLARENSWKRVTMSASLIATLSAAIPLNMKGELNLKGEFHCGPGGCIPLNFGASSGSVLGADVPTPSFDIGSAEEGRRSRGCVGAIYMNDAPHWTTWRRQFVDRWRTRQGASQNDVIWLIGSADAKPLAGQPRIRHESNSGLALARAERVAELLMADLGAVSEAPQHRLTPRRIVVIATGPAGTGTANARSVTDPCLVATAADHRRVKVWWQAASR